MRSFLTFAASSGVVALLSSAGFAEIYANAYTEYVPGNVVSGGGVIPGYNNPAGAFGKPNPFIGGGTFGGTFYAPTLLNPFNSHYEASQLVQVGAGGSMTLQFSQPVAVTGGPTVGIFTDDALNDIDWPHGVANSTANTTAEEYFGAGRSAVIEVAQTPGNFVSLGRVLLQKPTNYYTNISDTQQITVPDPAELADFSKPFTEDFSSFDGKSLSQILTLLDGSAGGNWLTVPTSTGLSEINYIRFSDPRWFVAGNPLAADAMQKNSLSNEFRYGYITIDTVVAVPEPASLGALLSAGALVMRRRRRA